MISKITIKRFKALNDISFELGKINVIVGANNSGKSSVLQALQFATSVAQTAKAYYPNSTYSKKGKGSVTITPEQLIYSPLKDPYSLSHKSVLKSDITKCIFVSFVQDDGHKIDISISKGKNKNLVAKFEGEFLGKDIASLEAPFCMYVPGLAGIPFSEEIKAIGAVRRIAAKGDSNTIFRNILKLLKEDAQKWASFIADMKYLFPTIELEVNPHEEIDGSIEVFFKLRPDDIFEPIDLAGTGVLQAIQIAAYVNFFSPKLLLLDEPDSHLHPNNQNALSSLLIHLVENNDFSIILSTHSRHLMSALRNDAQFFLVQNGKKSESHYSLYSGLLELGALDDYDLILTGKIKYVILTEDSSSSSQKHLSAILKASGMSEGSFSIYSYSGVDNLLSAKISAEFLTNLNPQLQVIIYRDRDGLYESEEPLLLNKFNFRDIPRVYLWISKYNDLEAHFCNEEHLLSLCNSNKQLITRNTLKKIVKQSIEEIKEESKGLFMEHRVTIADRLQLGRKKAFDNSDRIFNSNVMMFVYGKKLRGIISQKIQKRIKHNIDFFAETEQLKDPFVSAIINHSPQHSH